MSGPLIGLLGFAATLALIAIEVPVGVAMGIAGIVGYAILNGVDATGFVLGTAVFDGSYSPNSGSIRSQLKAVLADCATV